jgi:hypothetical protein
MWFVLLEHSPGALANQASWFVKQNEKYPENKPRRLLYFVCGPCKHWIWTKQTVPFVLFEFRFACKHWSKAVSFDTAHNLTKPKTITSTAFLPVHDR